MKTIQLTQGKVALVDDSDYVRVNQFKWQANLDKKTSRWYAKRSQRVNGKGTTIMMHRFILGVTDSKIEVDHLNHDGLDNQRYNIRECTKSQNQQNRVPKGKSKYLGVFWSKQWSKWFSSISLNNKKKFLGYHKTEKEAAKAYDTAVVLYRGPLSAVNFK